MHFLLILNKSYLLGYETDFWDFVQKCTLITFSYFRYVLNKVKRVSDTNYVITESFIRKKKKIYAKLTKFKLLDYFLEREIL